MNDVGAAGRDAGMTATSPRPETEAGRRLLRELPDGDRAWDGDTIAIHILAIERGSYAHGIRRASWEMEGWARAHAALTVGVGITDDAVAFAEWLRALARDIEAGRVA